LPKNGSVHPRSLQLVDGVQCLPLQEGLAELLGAL
jgi:hypothetical protein